MRNVILLDDQKEITNEFASYIREIGLIPYECQTIDEALEVIDTFKDKDEAVELFVFDHDLGMGDTSLNLIKTLEDEGYTDYQNHFIVATGLDSDDVTYDYAKYGSMGHLIKPIHKAQFLQTVKHVLKRIEYATTQREDWQSAYELLESEGLLDSIDDLKKNNEEINNQYVALKEVYDKLVEDLKDKKGEDIAKAYESASNSINRISGGFDLIFDINQNLKLSDKFTEDAKEVYSTNKILFFSLLNYMKRIDEAPLAYRIKYLTSTKGLYEYRTGRDYRLYFTKTDDKIQLERFGHKNVQEKIIETYR
jgi:DNA-binding response OmpR family regulator|nr:hypothetical protein [Moraxella sp. CTOTU46934]